MIYSATKFDALLYFESVLALLSDEKEVLHRL